MEFSFYLISTILFSKIIDIKFIKEKNIYIILFFLFSLHSYLYFLSLIILPFNSIILKIIITKNIFFIFLFFKINKSLFYQMLKELKKDQNLILFLILLFFFFILSKNLELAKFDEISSYGLYTKYIYYLREFPSADVFSSKNNISSLNFFSFFYLIILDFFNDYSESLLIFSNNLISLTLIFSVIKFLKITNLIKTIITFFIISSFVYIFLSGFDRIYLETILGLILLNIFFLIYLYLNKNESNKFYFILLLTCIIILIKKSSILLIFGILGGVFIILLIKKKFFKILLILILPFLILETSNDLTIFQYKLNKKNEYVKDIYSKDIVGLSVNKYLIKKDSYKLNKNKFSPFEYKPDKEIAKKIIKNHLKESFNSGIYHAYFLGNLKNILNTITNNSLSFIPIIPLNIYFWSIIIIYLFCKNFKNVTFLIYYFLYLITYYLFLIFWGFKFSLFDFEKLIIQVSWERHIGTILFPMIMFLILIKFNNYKTKTISILFIILLLVLPARTVRAFVPIKYLDDKNYYKTINGQKEYWKKFSVLLNAKLKNRSSVFVISKIFNDPLDYHLLNYYSIRHNIYIFDSPSFPKVENIFEKQKKIFIVTDNKFLCKSKKGNVGSFFIHEITDLKKINSFLECYNKNFK